MAVAAASGVILRAPRPAVIAVSTRGSATSIARTCGAVARSWYPSDVVKALSPALAAQ